MKLIHIHILKETNNKGENSMLTQLNERLIEVKEKMRLKTKYEDHIDRLYSYIKKEEQNRYKLRSQLEKEKEDVTRLETFTLTNIFYTITGRKLAKVDKEQQEVLAAKLKYSESVETLRDMEQEMVEFQKKLFSVSRVNEEYQQVLQEKEGLIHDEESIWSEKLYDIAEKEANLTGALKEYGEAIAAGRQAVNTLNMALSSLQAAKNWSTVDMFGGGLITTAMKHSNFDDAKHYIHSAQSKLRQFQEELLDIKTHYEANVEIGGMLTFVDYFFDSFIVDWIVHGKINESYSQTQSTLGSVTKVLNDITNQKDSLANELQIIIQERLNIVENKK